MKIKENVKTKIQKWFETDRDYESGKQLYMQHGFNLSFKNVLNRSGQSPQTFKYLCYELAKIAGISEGVYKKMLSKPLIRKASEKEEVTADVNKLPIEQLAAEIELVNPRELDYNVMKKLIHQLELHPANQKKATLINVLADAKINKMKEVVPKEIKRSFKLREEFPFLKNKECPEVLKILTADLLTAYDGYVEGHQRLMETTSEEEMQELSKDVVEDYLENRQIWDELNHYKTTGKFLGEHPIFEWMVRKEEIHTMDKADLVKLRDQLKNKIPRTKKLMADEPEHKDNAKRQERVEQFEKELKEVNLLLGIDG